MTIPYIKHKLKKMVDIDQAARSEYPVDEDKVNKIDTENTKILKQITDEHGWPTISKFGKKTSERAWLIAQHADLSPELQEGWLAMMEKVKDDVDLLPFAYLTDRVMVKQHGVQKYGTQLIKSGDHYVLRPLLDKENVNEYRKEAGLSTIEDYVGNKYWDKYGGAYLDEAHYLESHKNKESH